MPLLHKVSRNPVIPRVLADLYNQVFLSLKRAVHSILRFISLAETPSLNLAKPSRWVDGHPIHEQAKLPNRNIFLTLSGFIGL